jgi:hypothetical protein
VPTTGIEATVVLAGNRTGAKPRERSVRGDGNQIEVSAVAVASLLQRSLFDGQIDVFPIVGKGMVVDLDPGSGFVGAGDRSDLIASR